MDEMWTATMGKKTVRTTSLPDIQNVVVSKQYIGGSLFKSQNGTIWTPSQCQHDVQDLLKFVESGTVLWYNTDISADKNTDNAHDLNTNQFKDSKAQIPISNGGNLTTAAATLGTKIGESTNSPSITGFIENIGGPASTIVLLLVVLHILQPNQYTYYINLTSYRKGYWWSGNNCY